ncbi:MAG: hypothetical protein VKN33_00125 [Candidatus Sericytochromatia bacterium]|nr:hypothetical protein [Candidatus Sericytochromatia bacterium]
MRQPELSEAEIQKWTDFALEFRRAQQKLLKQKLRTERELATTHELLKFSTKEGFAGRYLQFQRSLLEAVYKNLEALPLTVDVYEHFTAMHSAPYAVRDIEITWCKIHMDALVYGELARFFNQRLQPEPAEENWPDFLNERWESWSTHTDGVLKFLTAWEALEYALSKAENDWREAAEAPSIDNRLKLLQALNVPALNGVAYRVNAALRLLPDGERVMSNFREQIMRGAAVSSEPTDKVALRNRIRNALRRKE